MLSLSPKVAVPVSAGATRSPADSGMALSFSAISPVIFLLALLLALAASLTPAHADGVRTGAVSSDLGAIAQAVTASDAVTADDTSSDDVDSIDDLTDIQQGYMSLGTALLLVSLVQLAAVLLILGVFLGHVLSRRWYL